jgi:hypothetical protein
MRSKMKIGNLEMARFDIFRGRRYVVAIHSFRCKEIIGGTQNKEE